MNHRLTKKQFLSVSIMLFGLFFGAGNLIFPPMLGHNSGENAIVSFIFFCVTAVVFPVLAVISVSKTKGLANLGSKVSPIFSVLFTGAVYLAIGPGLGIPRAGIVPFEMAVQQYLPQDSNLFLYRLIYTFVFFLLAFLISINPNKLVKRIGQFLTPTLLVLITVLFLGVFFSSENSVSSAVEPFASSPMAGGFLAGYDTMDAIAGLNFGLVVSLTIGLFNVEKQNDRVNYTVKAGIIAGSVLLLVYAALTYIGVVTSQLNQNVDNGAQILVNTVNTYFGNFGGVLLITIFTLACLTTSVGLITSISRYFVELTNNRVKYIHWAILWTVFSFIVGNFGLNTILSLSVPVLVLIYPAALVLTLMGLLDDKLRFSQLTYKLTLYVVSFISLFDALAAANIHVPLLSDLMSYLPLSSSSLAWLLPGFLVLVVSHLLTKNQRDYSHNNV